MRLQEIFGACSFRRVTGRSLATALAAALSIATSAPAKAVNNWQDGAWSPVFSWPLIPLHVVMTPDARILSYGTKGDGTQTGYFIYDVWDTNAGPTGGGHVTLPNTTGTDIFCSSQLILTNDTIFLSGGDNWTGTATTNTANNNTNIFNPANNTLIRGNNMIRPRWYGSSTMLLNGEVYIQGGSSGTATPEVRKTDGTFRNLSNVNTGSLAFQYPRNFVAPDGRIFGYDSNGVMYYISTTGNGSYSGQGQLPVANRATSNGSAAMFRPGRILNFGGDSNQSVVIDIRNGAPVVTRSGDMVLQRRLVNATILPDGKVLATGGSRVYNELTDVDYHAETWDPDTGTWDQGSVAVKARLYHSVAILLPDATVLVAGGGAPGPQTNLNGEIYSPSYLWDTNNQLRSRPTITSPQNTIDIGETFPVDFANAASISRVTMVKTGSATHSWNMEQRFVELPFATHDNRLSVQAPAHAADAPPGYYLLFALDSAGTPSRALFMKVNIATNLDPAVRPVLQNPGDQSGTVGSTVSLALSATDPNGDVLGYGATGLPPGVSINANTGVIGGTPTSAGSYNVVVSASDGINSDSKSFVWSIAPGSGPFTFNPPTPPSPAAQGSQATFTATATNGVNTLYQWNFGDGTAPTAWSLSGSATHTFAQPGVYSVTVTASSSGGETLSQTFLYAVYLPPTTNAPAATTNIAYEYISGGGSDRVWVVNQDNNSVSVLNAVTLARVAEIPVGAGPRTLTLTPGNEVWVANKFDASLTVINRSSLSVVRTIALPRASQPFGVAFSPTGANAWVALEAKGQVLRLDPTGATTKTITVGGNPRHLAITGDGTKVLVSRFVTAPLAGESTTSVQTASGGGDVAVITASNGAIATRVTLRASTKPDTETQGRGIPNYLGPAVISPDGTQAWVPSKQDNVQRGSARDGLNLDFQNTVRAISSRIALNTLTEDYAARIDHDNASMASNSAYDPNGVYLFVALETSREVAVIDAHRRVQLFRFDVGRAPQGIAVARGGARLYVNNFMDRTVSVFDLQPLLALGRTQMPGLGTASAIASEGLPANVLAGKQLFYDARDPRLARDAYMSCASCHNDGGNDGRVWDLTGFGEGLRNTINLRGRAGGQGFLHWSNNFDEVQDFEGQIRALSGGTGLMADSDFFAGTRNTPLGTPKAGVSAPLDQLAAYVGSLSTFESSPFRSSGGGYTAAAKSGRTVFKNLGCARCHGGANFTYSGANTLSDIGTLKPSSGNRLGQPLTGIDIPTLRDVWATAPYLHDGSAPTLEEAVTAHQGVSVTGTDLSNLVAFLQQIDQASAIEYPPTDGLGLRGQYFNNATLTGPPVLERIEQPNFSWSDSPGPGVNADGFSVRWTGSIQASATGAFQFQTVTNDGVRLWINGVLVIDNWNSTGTVTNATGPIQLEKGQSVSVVMEMQDKTASAQAKLKWLKPGATSYAVVLQKFLFPDP
jgi:YVTN family beta-propeller protein